jgi:hypothetical protein
MQTMATDERIKGLTMAMLTVLMLAAVLNLNLPAVAFAQSQSVEICGSGVENPISFTREELAQMEQHQYLYSSINTWPTKNWCVGKGVKLWDLLLRAGLKEGEATLFKFTARDGFTVTLTYQQLFGDKRYLFPDFKQGGRDEDGHLPGSPANRIEVEPIIALLLVEGSDNPDYMNTSTSLQLMLGQRYVTEQTANLFVKYLSKIEVLASEPEQWDAPVANPAPGPVPAGTMVTLSNLNTDEDKIHYTTDGSIPTIKSPIYNWIASRWWAARSDVLGTINYPIGPIQEDTTIKAVTIGPGKTDSPVVTFHYRVEPKKETTIVLTVDKTKAIINDEPFYLDAAPYLDLGAKRTLVPLRFIGEAFEADVGWNPKSGQISISLAEKEIILSLGRAEVTVNEVPEKIDSPPTLHSSGRTFVPLRFISEQLGAQNIDYDAVLGKIVIVK